MAEETQQPPDVDQLFPPHQQDVDELFPASVEQNRKREAMGASPVQDMLFSRDNVSAARVLSHFGQGFKEGWGDSDLTVTKEAADYMRSSGWFGDYSNGQSSIAKAANEALFRPAVIGLVGTAEAAFKAFSGAFRGAQEVVAQTGADVGQPRLGRELAAVPEAFMGTPHPTGIPKVEMPAVSLGEQLTIRARALKVIGAGEDGWKGTKVEEKPAVPERPVAIEQSVPVSGASEIEKLLSGAQPAAPPVTDGYVRFYHGWKAGGDPATRGGTAWVTTDPVYARDFRSDGQPNRVSYVDVPKGDPVEVAARAWDELDEYPGSMMVGRYRHAELPPEWASRMRRFEERGSSAPAEAPTREADVHTVARGIAPDLFTRYDEAQAQRTRAGEQYNELQGMRAANDAQATEIADLKGKLQDHIASAETQARELAPAVKEAYGEARKVSPTDDFVPEPALPDAKPLETLARPLAVQREAIINDLTEKMVAAGRPREEAAAAAAIDASYWETRAARFQGRKGTPEEMYRRDAPEILGEGMRSEMRPKAQAPRPDRVTLGQFVSKIGIKDNDPLIGDVKSITGGGRKYIRKDGVQLDKLREMAAEQGYIPQKSTIRTLLDALRDEDKGRKVHAVGEEHAAKFDADANTAAIEKALDDGLREVGLNPREVDPKVHARAVEIMDKENVSDPISAYERAEGEAGLFQGAEAIKRGRIRLREDGRNTITLLKDANASTFIHEKGHDYLARLIRDAGDELAPPQLKADVEATYRWLGVDKAEDIKTSHHEKFARGFENYVMEGRAPSHALARVFEQFRQWLLRIYTEASRLKAPLNADIRGVFDRMLALKPEDVVIAPDRAPERMAVSHEAQAAAASTGEADVAAGTVRAERDNLAARLSPEEQDARLAEIRAGLEGRTPGSAESLRDGNAAEPTASASRSGEEPGAVSSGGSEVAPESNPASKGAGVKTPAPAEPHATFAPSSAVADKAGNIRLDLLNTPDDVKSVIRQVADENQGFQSVRGPVTDIQVAELADAMGMDASYLSTRKLGEAWTAPEIVALRNLLIQSATSVRDLMRRAATGDEQALAAYAEAKTRHLMIQERVSSVTAQAGRALRAFQGKFAGGTLGDAKALGEFLKDSKGQTLFQLQREAQLGMSLETPSQVSKFIHDSQKATFSQMVQEFWINALLSGPITHVKNMIGNTAVAVLSAGESAATAGVGAVRAALGHEGPRVTAGEAKASLFGLVQGAQDGLRAAVYAFKHEDQYTRAQTVEQPKFQAIPSKRVVLSRYEQGSPEYNARLESIATARAHAERLTGEKLAARVEELKTNPTADMVLDASEKAVDIGGRQVRLPGRFLTAEDEMFKTIAYRQKINELAYRQAATENLIGDAFNRRMAQLTIDPPEALMTEASKHADYQTFTNTLGATGRAIQNFANSHFLAKMVVPFVRTPLNLLKYANDRTPLGVFSKEVRANLSGVNGKIAQDTQIARMTIGTSIAMGTMYLADQGVITGGGPSDKNEKALLMLSGWRPYSIKIGETYYSYSWLDPFSTIMGISADLGEAIKNGMDENGPEASKVASALFASIAKNVLSKSSLRGTSDLLNAATDPDRFGDRYIQNLAGSVIPSVVAQQAKAHDDYQREARTVLDTWKSRIPGQRETLKPKRDIWGEPMPAGENLGPDSFSPVAMARLTHDPATQALIDAGVFPSKPLRKIRGVDLTDQQYDDYTRIAGRMAKMRVNAIVSNPAFGQAPLEIRQELLNKTVTASREAARSLVMMQNPSIIKEAIAAKTLH